MNSLFKKEIEQSLEKMRTAKTSIQEAAASAESKAKGFWQDAEKQLEKIETKLTSAKSSLATSTDEALLQAHLAAMDASEHWGKLKTTIDSVALKSKAELDYTLLQSHLAKMDAQKFLDEDGKAMVAKFNQSREQLTKNVTSALSSMRGHMDIIASHLRRDV